MFAISHAIDLRPVLRTGRCVNRGRYGQIRGRVEALLKFKRVDGKKTNHRKGYDVGEKPYLESCCTFSTSLRTGAYRG